MRQTTNGVTTNYAIDLAGGLTQVLADSQHTYLYGNGRIAQYRAGGTDYFLGDALGSVRQLVDADGEVTLAKGYEPYGQLMSSAGSGATSYGFTNEWMDATGLVYLRARYYAPWQGRFLSRDAWDGDYNQPLTLNKWLYVSANPINFTDPMGLCLDDDGDGHCDPYPIHYYGMALRATRVGAPPIPDWFKDLACKDSVMIPTHSMRTISVNISPYPGVITFSYNLARTIKPISPVGNIGMLRGTGEVSVSIRTLIAEVGGYRLRTDVHAVAAGAGILFTAENRASGNWNCTSYLDCLTRAGQYAVNYPIAYDPLCVGGGSCDSNYGTVGGTLEVLDDELKTSVWLDALDMAATSYTLVRSKKIPDITNGSTYFAVSGLDHHFLDFHFFSGTEGHQMKNLELSLPCMVNYRGNDITCADAHKKYNYPEFPHP